ncbi:hypothetical protein Hamer_G030344, partial [Homarus americanus]
KDEDKEESRIIPAKDLKDVFFCWSKLSKLAEDYHPDVGAVEKGISVINDNVMNYFWKIQKSSCNCTISDTGIIEGISYAQLLCVDKATGPLWWKKGKHFIQIKFFFQNVKSIFIFIFTTTFTPYFVSI